LKICVHVDYPVLLEFVQIYNYSVQTTTFNFSLTGLAFQT